ncbi:hypothetical protein T459_20092 [Capsicum annuum]|uniref:Uncharacterized protein n=1 Tax=Capsicum annuum TaxID=4072 RepID=A0A2G2Z3G7_CAPAN|nr:hypothetical protein FXO37_23349 [Capsicum annuum]PHT76570.1 hypothetical protein T459_20092 [Capsicum annuum]
MDEDEDLVKDIFGEIPSHSLESRLGDCYRAASVRREAVHRITGRSLDGLSLDGFDYQSIAGHLISAASGQFMEGARKRKMEL